MNKILVPIGYMGSGSSAVTDILAEIDGCSARDGDFEFVFLHCPNGVFDLEDKLLHGNNAIRSDEALHSFLGTMKQLCTKKYWWVGHYNEHVGPGFYDLCLRFVDELTFSRPNYYWYWQENTNARMFVELCIRKIVWLLTMKKVLLRKPRTYYDTMLSIPTEEEFYSAASRFISGVMDEIGLQVKKIESDGRIKVCSVGWVWTSALYNDQVVFQNGVIGVVGCDGKIEDAKNDSGKLYIDIGCTSKEDTEKYVKVGDYAGFVGPWYELQNGRISAKTFDDRVGCFMLLEAVKRNKGDCPNDVYYVFSVQEEVGCRGAVTAAHQIRPDIGISVDVTPDHAYPCDLEGCNAVGEGISVTLGDPSAMLDEELVSEMLACCEENGIRYQRGVMDRGGTDASSMNQSGDGVRVAGIAVVDRYPHSKCSVIAKDDVTAGIDLLDKYTHRVFKF